MSPEALAEQYAYLVPATVKRNFTRVPPRIERDDLIGAGYLGLMKAARAFDPGRGVAFRTLAITYIRWQILEYLREEDWVPRSVRQRQRQGEAALIELVSLEHLLFAADEIGPGQPLGLGDTLPAPAPGPEARVLEGEERRAVGRAIGRLPARERTVLLGYYFTEQSQTQLGRRIGRTESRVYQLLQSARAELAADAELAAWADEGRRPRPNAKPRYFAAAAVAAAWSEEEIAQLRAWYPTTTVKELARRLGRTVGATKRKIARLRLTKGGAGAHG